jgi:hypothetical protein
MPKASVGCAGKCVEVETKRFGCNLVPRLIRLLIEHDENEKIGRQNIVERVNLMIRMALRVRMSIDPFLDVLEVMPVSGAFVDQILAKEIEAARISPAAELPGVGKASQGGVDKMLRPVKILDRRIVGNCNGGFLRIHRDCCAGHYHKNGKISQELPVNYFLQDCLPRRSLMDQQIKRLCQIKLSTNNLSFSVQDRLSNSTFLLGAPADFLRTNVLDSGTIDASSEE